MKPGELDELLAVMKKIKLEMENGTIECTPCTTENIKKDIAEKIKKEREAQGLTQKKLAENAETTDLVISQIENGRRNLTMKTLCQIADGLNCNIIIELVPKEQENNI